VRRGLFLYIFFGLIRLDYRTNRTVVRYYEDYGCRFGILSSLHVVSIFLTMIRVVISRVRACEVGKLCASCSRIKSTRNLSCRVESLLRYQCVVRRFVVPSRRVWSMDSGMLYMPCAARIEVTSPVRIAWRTSSI
jgi:hypothetical protein